MSDAVILLHGGELVRRSALAAALREKLTNVRVRTSSRAAEAAKALADPAMRAIVLLDDPADAASVRSAAVAVTLGHRVYEVQPRDDEDTVVGLMRSILAAQG